MKNNIVAVYRQEKPSYSPDKVKKGKSKVYSIFPGQIEETMENLTGAPTRQMSCQLFKRTMNSTLYKKNV